MDDTEAVNDEAFDAEAVLFALAEGLEWTLYPGCLKTTDDSWKELVPLLKATRPASDVAAFIAWHREINNTVECALVSGGYYSIRARRKFWFFRTYTACCLLNSPPQRGQHPQVFKRSADAKATCERHHTTGEW